LAPVAIKADVSEKKRLWECGPIKRRVDQAADDAVGAVTAYSPIGAGCYDAVLRSDRDCDPIRVLTSVDDFVAPICLDPQFSQPFTEAAFDRRLRQAKRTVIVGAPGRIQVHL
jgi:hypothetical protein